MKSTTSHNWLQRLFRSIPASNGRTRPTFLARPHKRPQLERLEDRTLPSVTIAATNNSGNGYSGLDFNQSGGYVPPDTNGAAGPTNYVETVNQTLAIYSPKATGAMEASDSFSHFYGVTGGLPLADSGAGYSDPVVVYDDNLPGLTATTGRFVVEDQNVDFSTHVSVLDVAVSKTASPATLTTADWNFYQVVTTQNNGTANGTYDADYPGNFGYNNDAVVTTLNMFPVGTQIFRVQVISLNASDLVNGVSQANLHVFHNNIDGAPSTIRPTTEHDVAAGAPEWLVSETGDGQHINVYKMTNVLSNSATLPLTQLAVTQYLSIKNPLNPNGTAITNNIDSRIQKSAESNNTLVAAHALSPSLTQQQDVIQWYQIDVSSGTPTMADQGRVSAGNNTYLYYPAIDINSSGQIGMTYMRSGTDSSTDYMSMWLTGRTSSDAAGTMETPVLVPAGMGQANYRDFTAGGRAGDLSGISVDPSDGSFWAANEFANTEATANWGTAVANFSVGTTLGPADLAVTNSGPSSVTAGTNATYMITLTNNGPNAAQGVVLSDLLPAGSTFVSLTPSGTNPDSFTFAQSGNTVTETATATVASGHSDTFTLVVSAPASLSNGAPFNDTVTVSANNPDPTSSDNSATVTGSVVNNNPTADLDVTAAGPATGNEGDTVTYTFTVTNNGPNDAQSSTLTDALPPNLHFVSATTTQGTFSQSGGVVTFSLGTVAVGGSVTATVTAQAFEDGNLSSTANVSSGTPDSNTANNNATVTTAFAEAAIVVSGAIRTKATTLTNFTVATFTHANAVEPVGAFTATISWGDGTTSPGTVSLSSGTYSVVGSHTYARGNGNHTITTTVTEVGNFPAEGGPGNTHSWRFQDVVHTPGNSWHPQAASPPAANPGFEVSVSPPATPGAVVNTAAPSGTWTATHTTVTGLVFSLAAPGGKPRSPFADDWSADSDG
jgi:uncharacterized repeat protein (TIGR01451 family)